MAETLVFRLSNRLGGRSEVLGTPLVELLAYASMESDREQREAQKEFMNMYYANPMVDKKARKDYLNSLFKAPVKREGKTALVTDFNQLKLIKEMQEIERKQERGK